MPMPPELIVFSIHPIARLAHVTNDALEQWTDANAAGCTALTVSDANRQLTGVYRAKVAAMQATPRDETGLLLAQTSLSQVADDAGAAVA